MFWSTAVQSINQSINQYNMCVTCGVPNQNEPAFQRAFQPGMSGGGADLRHLAAAASSPSYSHFSFLGSASANQTHQTHQNPPTNRKKKRPTSTGRTATSPFSSTPFVDILGYCGHTLTACILSLYIIAFSSSCFNLFASRF